jgi:hypothetical protein
MVLADISFGDVLWSIVVVFFFVIFLWMIFGIVGDLFRSDDLSGWGKALWCIFLVLFPFVTVFVYLVTRGRGMAERSAEVQQRAEQQFRAYVRETAGAGNGAAAEIKSAKELLDSGAISQQEYEELKHKALARS